MNIAEFSIRKNIVTWTLTVVLLLLGYLAYRNLSRLEDPEFVIKDAVVVTPYPGASPDEVEKEVTEKIEKAVQELGQLRRIESYSSRGLSTVKVTIQDSFDKTTLPQVWDEMRRKIYDVQGQLPPGAGPSIINDDFGDVYGVYFALTGDGYSYAELKEVAELLKRELLTVVDVKKVVFFGEQTEAIYVAMSREKMAALGITRQEIFNALSAKNLPVDSGKIRIGSEYIPIFPTGIFKSAEDFGELFIASRGGKLIYLKDVADIRRDYVDPPRAILRFNSKPAIGIAISTVQGGNAVTMGDAVKARIGQLMPQIPVGMELGVIAMQSDAVTEAVNGFVINLVEAVLIVIVVLLFFMGLRSGLIIGFILVLTIAATFVLMDYYAIALERISLGALIIALGMLVDNAIVVVDGMKVRMEQGMDGMQAAKEVVGQNSIPLLGATAVAVLAFAAIGSMQNSTGEYCRSLYYVILISLSLSWLTAVTTTPLATKLFVLSKKAGGSSAGKAADPYGGRFYQVYRRLLITAIRFRWVTIAVVAGMFAMAIFGFGYVDNMFFPPSTRPQIMVECQFREGNHIRETEAGVARMEAYLRELEGVTDIASAIGSGHSRFLLTYDVPVDAGPHYCSILVGVTDFEVIEQIYTRMQNDLERMMPDVTVNVKKFALGPGAGGKIQLRINGPDPVVLRGLADKAMAIMEADPETKALRSEWGAPVKVVQPVIAEDRARRQGIDRPMIAQAIQSNFSGTTTGVYREGIELIPIIARAPAGERSTMENMRDIQVYSPMANRNVPLSQVIDGFETRSENARISRRQRRSMIKMHCDARTQLPSQLFARLKPKIEQALGVDTEAYLGKAVAPEQYTAETIKVKYDDIIPLKDMPGYFMAWSGEAEDSADAQRKLGDYIPIFFGLMILTVICLFNAFRQPLIIWLTVPLSLIGVTAGLLLLGQPFGFMALLGLMSLSGMLIKNAIVLIDQIDLEIRDGKAPFHAVVDSGVSRMRPVMLAALTTMMGMIPLFQDAFFISMAVTIVFGLGFASLLTLVFVPTLYTAFFKIPCEPDN
ncbi:multidrug transporter AcrB [Desulfosarcina alkanivorans]|uniref:Multidrug transporter AcrB n=1 Tax=Desulfosarcina alkanivorans TaxID=571177 RepID=A0A5K7YR59_9BACT|nr:efflux RND transporter permease subunit [Desulfosarcina alkanivorans]BBO69471.1 multidrug transporter AcrB [Desulfosarcina alkanivorans]